MESIGEKLKAAREEKGLTHDQISRDIHIARQYLVALEEEDFNAFPGETYLIGFLKNYADYLGLDQAELVSMYKHLRIQEEPIPVEQLLEKKKSSSPYLIAGIAGGVVLLVVIILVVVGGGKRYNGTQTKDLAGASVDRSVYFMDGPSFDKRVYQGDQVVIQLQSQKFPVDIKSIGDSVTLGTGAGSTVVNLGDDTGVDLTGDSLPDVKVYIKDLDKKDPKKGANIHFELISGAAVGSTPIPGAPAGDAAAAAGTQTPGAATPAPQVPAAPSGTSVVLLESRNPYPFTVVFNFRGYCMFRWEIDRKDATERYFHKTESMTVSANNGIRVWLSNASSAKGTVANKDFEFGGAGEAVAKSIKWVRDDSSGSYKLTVVPFE